METRLQLIRQKLESDPAACDFQLSLFVAAFQSYRHDTVLRPFPPMFTAAAAAAARAAATEGEKDYKALENVVSKLPSLAHVAKEGSALTNQQSEFLHWVLDSKNFTLKRLEKSSMSTIKSLTEQCVSVPEPNYIFEVVHSEQADEKFVEIQQGRKLMYGYHGTRIDNFHSILHHGLQGHLSKNALFGEGTYLSSELSVSMPYAPAGSAWDHSKIGDRLSCIAVCEMIDDASVKCQSKEVNGETVRNRAHVRGSLGGEIPEKYYVVRNNEMMRIKYVLVYAEKSKPKWTSSWKSWMFQHKFAMMVLCYVLLLMFVGLYNSRNFQYYVRKYWKQ